MPHLDGIEVREYQRAIAKSALESNTLVVLPTGLGKTVVALLVAVERLGMFPGEKVLKSASKEERVKAQHLLAGTMLLYLAGSGKGPVETFVWEKKELEALVESGLLTREEIQPLLEVCKLVYFDGPPIEGRSAVQLEEDRLTDEQMKRITASAYRRFHLASEQMARKP
jgi:Rad3-related DNA helicase